MTNDKQLLLKGLSSLSGAPDEQAAYALTLLEPKNGLAVVRSAVTVLEKNPLPKARGRLRDLYWYYADKNGTRDPAAYTRTVILKALRQVMGYDDTELVVHAVSTYEFLPPNFTEEAALLRGTAIVLMAELDDSLAMYYATRLMADGYTEPMSGQPALMAVQVLSSLGALLPLFYYACQRSDTHPEVVSECLRNLNDAPSGIISLLVEQYRESANAAAMVGLFDLLTTGPNAPQHPEFLAEFLRTSTDADLYRYLITILATSPNSGVRRLLADAVVMERNASKIAMLQDALSYAPESPELVELKRRIG